MHLLIQELNGEVHPVENNIVITNDSFAKLEKKKTVEVSVERQSVWKDIWKELRKNKVAMVSVVLLAILIIAVLLAPLSPYDPYKLDAFKLTINDLSSKIEANNQSVSGGRVSELGLQYLVKSSSLFATESDFENLIVGYKPVAAEATASGTSGAVSTSSMDKAPIFLREVATVSFENDRPEKIVRINGKRSIGLSVYK